MDIEAGNNGKQMEFKPEASNVGRADRLLEALDGPIYKLDNKGRVRYKDSTHKKNPIVLHDLSKLNPEAKESIRGFIEQKKVEGHEDSTIAGYVTALLDFSKALGKFTPSKLGLEDYKKFSEYAKDMGWSSTTKRVKWNSHLKPYLNWVFKGDIPQELKKVNIKNDTKRKKALSAQEVEALIKSAPHVRDRCYIAMQTDTGLRKGELTGIRIKDITFKPEYAEIEVKHSKSKKKNDYFSVVVVRAFPYLVEWMQVHPYGDNKEAFLFCTYSGNEISTPGINQAIKVAAKRANISNERISSHYLRHSAITHYLNEGFNTEQLKAKLHYSQKSRVLTEVYSHVQAGDVIRRQLQMAGIIQDEEKIGQMVACGKCGLPNNKKATYCSRCREALTPEARKAIRETERGEIAELREQMEEMRDMMAILSDARVHDPAQRRRLIAEAVKWKKGKG